MQIRRSRSIVITATALLAFALVSCAASAPQVDSTPQGAAPALPPAGAGFDYQLGGAYEPAEDVLVVARDRTDSPASGRYSICYLNAFQTQPGELSQWPDGAVLKDATGEPVWDPDWPDEALLDISSPAAQDIVVDRVGSWIEECAADGFSAVEFDNLDSFTRSDDALSAAHALAVAARLVEIAHASGLAAGQKNAAESARTFHDDAGFDFAVSEECAVYRECAAYTDVYGDAVLNIEYTDALPRTFAEMCADPTTPRTTILRDRDLTVPSDAAYVREIC